MCVVLFILGLIIGVFICYTILNIKELKRMKNKNIKALSAMNAKEFKQTMKDLEIK